jgi:hypothetical protein
MPEYRFYKIGRNGHISGPPIDHEAPDDQAAIQAAKALIKTVDIEIWQGPRVVAYLTPDGKTRLP